MECTIELCDRVGFGLCVLNNLALWLEVIQRRFFLEIAYHLTSKELKSLQRSHSLRSTLDISENNMRLPSHLHGLQCDNVENRSIGAEQHV